MSIEPLSLRLTLVAASLVALSACGGGSDTSSGTPEVGIGPLVKVDSGNYVQVGARASKASFDAGRLSQRTGDGDATVNTKAGEAAALGLQRLTWAKTAWSAGTGQAKSAGSSILQAVNGSQTLACTGGGSVTITATLGTSDRDTVGDRIVLAYDRCLDFATRHYNDGVLGFEFLRVGAGRLWMGAPYDVSLKMTFVKLLSIDQDAVRSTADGELTVSTMRSAPSVGRDEISTPLLETSSRVGLVEQRSVLADLAATVTHSLAAEAASLDGFASVDDIAYRSVRAQTLTPFTRLRSDAYPSSGVIVFTGEAGSSVTMTALSAVQVRFDLDSNGDGVIDASTTVDWSTVW